MNQKVIIIGASGHGKVILDTILASGDTVLGFLDDMNTEKEWSGYPILGKVSDYAKYLEEAKFIVAIGNASTRERMVKELTDAKWYTAIHPSAIISPIDTTIEEGTCVMANAVINPGAKIGKHCIINTASVVEHDNVISDFVHISVGAKTAGTVYIGSKTWIGIGATISNNIRIESDVMVGAGAVVVDNIEEMRNLCRCPG